MRTLSNRLSGDILRAIAKEGVADTQEILDQFGHSIEAVEAINEMVREGILFTPKPHLIARTAQFGIPFKIRE